MENTRNIYKYTIGTHLTPKNKPATKQISHGRHECGVSDRQSKIERCLAEKTKFLVTPV